MRAQPQPSVAKLSTLLLATPPGRRGAVLSAAVSFRPSETLEESTGLGPIRSAFVESWEELSVGPVSAPAFNAALKPPVPIGLVIQFNKLVLARDEAEMKDLLGQLFRALQAHLESRQPWKQRPLFDAALCRPRVTEQNLVPGESVSTLAELVEKGRKFRTIYADPPWPYQNEASRGAAINHYPTLSLESIAAEPVRELSADDAHLHLWTTNGFLREALSLIDVWGFEFKSCLVWVKDELGMGNYWRVSHEFLLLGIRGSLTFRDRTLPSWIQAGRTLHSRKPGIVRALVERASPGPYLELYGREELPDSEWTVYGNQVGHRHW